MQRFHNWQTLLSDFFRERKYAPFQWGSNDCCMFAADAVLVQTGIDLAKDVRGSYSDPITAARILSEAGGVRGIATSVFGPPLPAKMARVGDICVANNMGRDLLMVCGGLVAVGPGETGLMRVPMKQIEECWRI